MSLLLHAMEACATPTVRYFTGHPEYFWWRGAEGDDTGLSKEAGRVALPVPGG